MYGNSHRICWDSCCSDGTDETASRSSLHTAVSVHKDGYKDSITRFTITENKEIDLVLETE